MRRRWKMRQSAASTASCCTLRMLRAAATTHRPSKPRAAAVVNGGRCVLTWLQHFCCAGPSAMADRRHGDAARRIAATLGHVLGGDEAPALARAPTAGSVAVTPADVPALQRLLDHDNHDMRTAMKNFMKDPLFLPVRGARPAPAGCGRLWFRSCGAPADARGRDAALRHAAARGARAGAGAAVADLRAEILLGAAATATRAP